MIIMFSGLIILSIVWTSTENVAPILPDDRFSFPLFDIDLFPAIRPDELRMQRGKRAAATSTTRLLYRHGMLPRESDKAFAAAKGDFNGGEKLLSPKSFPLY